jgi:lipopolysaccharide biosynthesis protein
MTELANKEISLLTFYLPQFHPIPENDAWWGKGFTEWTNVVQARPRFSGHYQPQLPADLGFYDLRLPEMREQQAQMASQYGITGFCYYHYWFNGKRLLNRPFDEVLQSGEPDFPFCLCWANENWTRRWDGQDNEILIQQHYSEEDDREHIRWLLKAFQDGRYIRYKGKPLFLVYRASLLPDVLRTTTVWREEARKAGIGELFLCRVERTARDQQDPADTGFDAGVEFQPFWEDLSKPRIPRRFRKLRKIVNDLRWRYRPYWRYNYGDLVEGSLKRQEASYDRFRCVTPAWDNSPRRKTKARIVHGSTPDQYEAWLTAILRKVVSEQKSGNIVFINGWNEWAEGNHLEPDQRFGRAYLEATARALDTIRSRRA